MHLGHASFNSIGTVIKVGRSPWSPRQSDHPPDLQSQPAKRSPRHGHLLPHAASSPPFICIIIFVHWQPRQFPRRHQIDHPSFSTSTVSQCHRATSSPHWGCCSQPLIFGLRPYHHIPPPTTCSLATPSRRSGMSKVRTLNVLISVSISCPSWLTRGQLWDLVLGTDCSLMWVDG